MKKFIYTKTIKNRKGDVEAVKNILLACGAGASSGFIAQKMRKAAQSRGLEVGIRAISDTEIMENIDGVGVLLIGPHLKHKFAEIESEVAEYQVKTMLIDRKYYATLDGEAVLKQALELMD